MPNILEDLYYGNLSPCQRTVRPGSCVKKLMQKQSELESKLNGSFTEEQREDFEQYSQSLPTFSTLTASTASSPASASAHSLRTKSSLEQTRPLRN